MYLLNNNLLINNLLKNNLTLYFTLHHSFAQYRDEFKINQNIIYIEENEIAECLSKTNLIVTDYSSIIFDIIYRRKPFIIYIPDINDPMNKENYENDTYNSIKLDKLEKPYIALYKICLLPNIQFYGVLKYSLS